MEEKWNLGRVRETCTACGREIAPGEELVSALRFNGVEFERHDYCPACWDGVRQEDLYSHWRTRIPEREEKPKARAVNLPVLEDLFQQLIEEKDPAKEAITFFLGMFLVQKRVLKYRSTRLEEGKRWIVLGRSRSDAAYEVVDPGMDAARMDEVRESLKRILDVE